jgi:membrane protein implicated in regulation of membrane protease activity
MTWATFYLVCFVVGVAFSVLSFVGGSLRLPHFHLHLPHGAVPHAPIPHAGGGVHAASGGDGARIPFFNFATMPAFLAWFGGTGYLLTLYSTMVVVVIMIIAVGAGLLGAAIIFWFAVKVLLKHDVQLDPADYDRIGALARIVSPIRAGGTGEIVFSQAGTRHTCGARSEDNVALARGTEVIITRYEHGIAYVRRWEEMSDGSRAAGESNRTSVDE